MPESTIELELRPATLDDVDLVADLEALREPDTPLDPVLIRHWWAMADAHQKAMRRVAVRDGAALAFVAAVHELWDGDEKRYGTIRVRLRDDVWSDTTYGQLVRIAEDWLREEHAELSVVRIREDFARDLAAVESLGYRENRRMRISELDLVARREMILGTRDQCRRRMRDQGVRMLVLSDDPDPQKYQKLYSMVIESEKDIPTTVPWRTLSFEEWRSLWFDSPTTREDSFWIAREDDRIVGTSVLDIPVERGIPFTAYTGTSRAVRGRGIARALKYESLGQAVEAGYTRARTSNDSDNPAILRINEEMGYRPVAPVIELHRALD